MPLDKLRQHIERGEYVQARREAERLIHVGELHGADLVHAYRGAALAHHHLQDVFAAVKLGEKAMELANSLGDWELIGKARADLGTFYLKLGDSHLAREFLLAFLRDLDRYLQLRGLEALVHHNVGLVFRQRKEFQQALASHRMAASLFEQQSNLRSRIEALRGVIWCLLNMGDPLAAWEYIQEVSEYLKDHPDESLAAHLLTDLAYYYQLKGDVKTSMDFCEEALVPGRPGVNDQILATASVLAGENALSVGQCHEASIFANLALDYALKAKHPLVMNRVSALRRLIHDITHSPSPE